MRAIVCAIQIKRIIYLFRSSCGSELNGWELSRRIWPLRAAIAKNGKQLDGVEFDVQMTADGKFVVVFYDETLNRSAGQQSWIADKTWAEQNAVVQSTMGVFPNVLNWGFKTSRIVAKRFTTLSATFAILN